MVNTEKIIVILNRYLVKDEANDCFREIMDILPLVVKAKEKYTIDEYNWLINQLKEVGEYLRQKPIEYTPDKIDSPNEKG